MLMNHCPILPNWPTTTEVNMNSILLVLLASLTFNATAADKAPKKSAEPPLALKIQKPCKKNQTEADGCRVVKRATNKPVKK